jgi:hypothetical protein
MPSFGRNASFSSRKETSFANQKQSFSIKDPQYHVIGVKQRSFRYSNTSTTDTMVTTIQFSIPLTP